MFLFRRSGAIFCTQNVSGSQRSAFLLKWRINAFALNHAWSTMSLHIAVSALISIFCTSMITRSPNYRISAMSSSSNWMRSSKYTQPRLACAGATGSYAAPISVLVVSAETAWIL